MSIKDDFLEALKGVKSDFFRDPGGSGSVSRPEPEPEFSEIFSSHASGPVPDPVPPPYQSESVQGGGYEESGVDMGGGPFAGTASGEYRSADIHSGEMLDAMDEEDFAPDVDPTPYRTAMDPPPEPPVSSGGNEPPRDSRVLFDDNGGAYSDDRTIISKNTVVRGELQTEDSVRMFGQFLGDIDCKSNILVAGKVRGNTSAANAYVIDAQVDGNLLCDDVINITDDAWILGNIRAQQAEIDGKIKGNIEIRHTISIGANSSVIGNISTDELEIKRGAFVNGQIMMYSPSRDVIDRFDQFEK